MKYRGINSTGVAPRSSGCCEFVETTLIGAAEFGAAQQAAQAQYDDVLRKGYLSRGLFDPGGFAG